MSKKITLDKLGLHDSIVTSITFNFRENNCELRVKLHEILKKEQNLDYNILTLCFQDIVSIDFDKWLAYSFDSFEIMEIKNKYLEKLIEVSILLLAGGQKESLYWNMSIRCKNIILKKESFIENGNKIK
jgi:hypothetical protein